MSEKNGRQRITEAGRRRPVRPANDLRRNREHHTAHGAPQSRLGSLRANAACTPHSCCRVFPCPSVVEGLVGVRVRWGSVAMAAR